MTIKFKDFEYKPINIDKVKVEFKELIEKFKNAKSAKEQIELVKEIDKYSGELSTSTSLCSTRFNINTFDKYYEEENNRVDGF